MTAATRGALLIGLMLMVSGGQCLRLTAIKVPALAIYGDQVALECRYHAEGDTLYTVKWYKNSDEFYCYTFANRLPINAFSLPGIKVDVTQSNSSRVVLKSVNFDTSATYRCEVSTDLPYFQTFHGHANMTVIKIDGEEGPLISGMRDRYELNAELNVNCTAPTIKTNAGHPLAQQLSWQFNKRPVQGVALDDGNNSINLKLALSRHHFDKDGVFYVSCTASIGNVYTKSVQVTAAYSPPGSAARKTNAIKAKERSASYSSGDGRPCQWFIVVLTAILPFALPRNC